MINGLRKKLGKQHPLTIATNKTEYLRGNSNQTNETSVSQEFQVFEERNW